MGGIGQYDGLIFAVNATAGVLLALLFGVAAARARPDLARGAKLAVGALLASYVVIVLFGLGLHPYAALVPLAFGSAAWAAAPFEPPTVATKRLAVAAGVGTAALFSVYSAFNLWWTIPFIGLIGGFLRALWQARPDFLRKPEDREKPPVRLELRPIPKPPPREERAEAEPPAREP